MPRVGVTSIIGVTVDLISSPWTGSLTQTLIAFIGGGNMAASLIGGLLAAGHPAARLRASVRTPESAARLRLRFGVEAVTDNAAALRGAGIVVLAVKPQLMAEALSRPAGPEAGATVILGSPPGCGSQRWRAGSAPTPSSAPCPPPRAAPAPASAVACTPTMAVPSARARPGRGRAARRGDLLGGARGIDRRRHRAVSGCGPAYYFHLTEVCCARPAQRRLDPSGGSWRAEHFHRLRHVAAKEAGEDVAVLRAQVTSKGGSTEAALAHLESAGLRRIFGEALAAADARARLRGEELAQDCCAFPVR